MTPASVRQAFGFTGEVTVAPGPRGAMGRVWRVEAAGHRYALKETFFNPPTEAFVAAETAFVRRAAGAGVRAPSIHRDGAGRHLVPGPDGGGWLRLYDWVDVRPLDLTAADTPRLIGELLARLHRAGVAATTEVGGGAPESWYERPPDLAEFDEALASGAPWVPRLAERLAVAPQLVSITRPIDVSRLVLCHRDLHPANVLADETGEPVVLDWDNLGPADPSRELAQALFDWWSDPAPDLEAMRATYEAYLRSGGPGRVTTAGEFTMLICVRLNFLLLQSRAALDAGSEHRQWAEQEIDEALRILPTPGQIADVLALVRQTPPAG